ncbi:MAG: hypothetical protein V4612_06175 [Pseudomonadota bacterium]
MKIKNPLILLIFCLIFPNLANAALNGGSPPDSGGSGSSLNSDKNKNFSESSFGAGLALGVRFNLADDIFFDSQEVEFGNKANKPSSKKSDHIFTEIGVFGNQFLSGEIKQNFGGKINLGYETHGFRIYGSGGYVASTFDYQEQGQKKESLIKSAPFFGGGIGYDITKNISLRLDGMFYEFDFKPKNSGFNGVNVSVAAGAFGVGVYF